MLDATKIKETWENASSHSKKYSREKKSSKYLFKFRSFLLDIGNNFPDWNVLAIPNPQDDTNHPDDHIISSAPQLQIGLDQELQMWILLKWAPRHDKSDSV